MLSSADEKSQVVSAFDMLMLIDNVGLIQLQANMLLDVITNGRRFREVNHAQMTIANYQRL